MRHRHPNPVAAVAVVVAMHQARPPDRPPLLAATVVRDATRQALAMLVRHTAVAAVEDMHPAHRTGLGATVHREGCGCGNSM